MSPNIRLTEEEIGADDPYGTGCADPLYTETKVRHKHLPAWFKIAVALLALWLVWLMTGCSRKRTVEAYRDGGRNTFVVKNADELRAIADGSANVVYVTPPQTSMVVKVRTTPKPDGSYAEADCTVTIKKEKK